MILKSLTKNPILMIGIIFMGIFLMNLSRKGYFTREKLIPTSCRAVLVKLNRRVPENWKAECEGNNLAVTIELDLRPKKESELRSLAYRELANNLIHLAKNSPSDNLERTNFVRLKMTFPKLIINALTEGKFLVKFQTIKTKELILQHLKKTVHVKETPR